MNKQRLKAKLIKYFLQSCGSLSIIIVLLIFLFLFKEAFPFIGSPGIGELFHNIWNPVSFQKEEFGLIPLITGSVLVTILATVIAIPFGIIGAVYISEGIPSVVLGFFGLIVIAPFIKDLFGLNTGLTALTGAVLLAFMAIPTIMSISEDAIKSVPAAYKEASLALGASKLETIWKVVVPAALSGIVASVMLGMGRVVGETMTVMMVTGNAPVISMNPFTSVRTMTATIAAEMGEVTIGSDHYMALFWVGIVLMLMTFSLNLISYRVLKKYGMIDK